MNSVSIFAIYYDSDANVNALEIRQTHLSFQPPSKIQVAQTPGNPRNIQDSSYPSSILERKRDLHFLISLANVVVKEL